MNQGQKEEYEKHYSPDGEKIEYLIEHPEEPEDNGTFVDHLEEIDRD